MTRIGTGRRGYIAGGLVLAVLAVFAVFGVRSARATVQFLNDGAIPNGVSGGWDLPPQGTCPAAGLNGYTGITTRPLCVALRLNIAPASCVSPNYSNTTSGVCNDLVNTTQTSCENAGDRLWNPGTTTCAVVMSDDDRNDVTCALHGGTWVTTATCIGVWVMPARTAYSPALLTGTGPGDQCLRCHNSTTQYNGPRVRDVEDTLYMGHRNMSRKVTFGQAWGGPPLQCDSNPGINVDEELCEAAGAHWYPMSPYPSDDAGNPINWSQSQITLGGFQRDMLWIYGDWLSPEPRVIAELPASASRVCSDPRYTCPSGCASSSCTNGSATDCVFNGGSCWLNAGASYSCARCHTTGWTSDASINLASGIEAKEPEQSFPNVTWNRTGDAPANVVNLSGGVKDDPNQYASWDNFGIVCTRCHGSAIDTTKGDTSTPTQYSAPTGMSSHHSNLTAADNNSGVCTNPQWTAEAQCTGAGGQWLTSCTVNPTTGVCAVAANTSTKCAAVSGGTWTSVPAFCSNAFYSLQADCTANGFTWQDGFCTVAVVQASCTGGSGDAAKTWRGNGTQASCQLNAPAGTWSFSKCSLEGVCNRGTCSNPTYTDAVNCKAHAAMWTPVLTPAACALLPGGQFRYATDIVRCIDAGGEWTGNNTNRGQIITALCTNCHRQETSGVPYADTGSGAGSVSTSHPGSYVKVGAYHSTVSYPSHPHGNMFLNGAHGKFSGLFNEIATSTFGAGYGSFFQFEGEAANTGNGCTGCHNPHRSTVQVAGIEEAIEPCQKCHTGQYAVDLTKINHLSGPGTPLEKMNTEPAEPCITCHMPKGEHMFRINPDVNYSTFPMPAALTSTTNANTAPDGTFTNAVWVDVDAACGQCHGGGTGQASTTLTAPTSTSSSNLTVASTTGFTVGQRLMVADAGNFEYDGDTVVNGDFESYVVSITPPNTLKVVGAPPFVVGAGKAVIQNPTKNGALYRTKAVLAPVAEGMHSNAKLAAQISFTASATGLAVNVDASVSCGATPCPALVYGWDWGDGSSGSGDPASHTYAAAGSKTITLTVKLDSTNANNTTVGMVKRSVTVIAPNSPPATAGTCNWTANTWTMTVQDSSTDTDAWPVGTVVVEWGDGSVRSVAAPGTLFSHVYINPGDYTVTQRAIDTSPLSGPTITCSTHATPAPFTIQGHVYKHNGTTPISAAAVQVKKAGVTIKTVFTDVNGFYTAGGLKPGTYTLTVGKTGYVFPGSVAVPAVGPSNTGNDVIATSPL